MVELDEDFVVERVNGGGSEVVNSQEVSAAEVVGEQSAPTHRYVVNWYCLLSHPVLNFPSCSWG